MYTPKTAGYNPITPPIAVNTQSANSSTISSVATPQASSSTSIDFPLPTAFAVGLNEKRETLQKDLDTIHLPWLTCSVGTFWQAVKDLGFVILWVKH